MLSIFGAVIGLLGSFIPKLLEFFKVKEDHKHELAVMQVQAEIAKSEHLYRMEEINVNADIASEQAVYRHAELKYTGVRWVDGVLALYSGTIRPTITYLFVGTYIFVKYAQLQVLKSAGGNLWEIVWKLWNSEDMAAFMCVLGFWFGGRLMKHNMEVFGVGGNGNGNSLRQIAPPTVPIISKPVEKPKPEGASYEPPPDNSSGF